MNRKQLTTGIAVAAGLFVVSIFFLVRNPFDSSTPSDASVQAASADQQLIVQDEKIGTGPQAKLGDVVTVNYIGKLKDGTTFDSSYGGTPLQFQIGDSTIIAGWNAGLQGMKVGGKRLLIIPPQLAYGSHQVGAIPPNSTLVFEVDLLAVSATTTLPQ